MGSKRPDKSDKTAFGSAPSGGGGGGGGGGVSRGQSPPPPPPQVNSLGFGVVE